MEWFMKVLRQYADFDGRARRKEYWMFALFYIVFSACASLLDEMSYSEDGFQDHIITNLFVLGLFIPSLAVSVRRLHDIGKSGWYLLLWFLPVIGWLWVIFLHCQDSEAGPNHYGPNPKGISNDNLRI